VALKNLLKQMLGSDFKGSRSSVLALGIATAVAPHLRANSSTSIGRREMAAPSRHRDYSIGCQ